MYLLNTEMCQVLQKKHITSVVTFDQPLYWKAKTIVAGEPEGSGMHCCWTRRIPHKNELVYFVHCNYSCLYESWINYKWQYTGAYDNLRTFWGTGRELLYCPQSYQMLVMLGFNATVESAIILIINCCRMRSC